MLLLPYQATMLPEYIFSQRINLNDSLLSVIIFSIFDPLTFIILIQLFRRVSQEQIDAFRLENSSLLKELWYVAIPAIKEGIACCILLAFVRNWNSFDRPICLLSDSATELLQQHISNCVVFLPLLKNKASVISPKPEVIFLF